MARIGMALGLAIALTAPAAAQDAPAGPTADQQQAYAAAVAELEQALGGSEPHIGKLYALEKVFQKLVGFWELDKPYKPGPYDGDADAHYHFARACLYLAPACHPKVAMTYTWQAALGSSRRCVELNANHPEGWLLYAKIRSDRLNGFNWAEAMPGYENDLVLNPERLESHQWRTFGYLQIGQPAKAVAAAQQGLQHHPDAAKLHELLADALYQLTEYQRARDAYGAAAHLDPKNHALIDKWINSDLLAAQKAGQPPMPDVALQWLADFDEQHPEEWKAGEKRAWLYIEQMWPNVWRGAGADAARPHADAGVRQLMDLAERFPDDLEGVYWMQLAARVYRSYQEYSKLSACVVDGIRRDPANPDLIMGELANADRSLNLFDEYRNARQWTECEQLADDLLAVLPTDTILANQRRAVLYHVKYETFLPRNMLDAAETAIQAAIAADPANGQYHNVYGLLLRYLGRTEGAIEQFRAALRIDAGHEWPSTNLATSLLELGRWDEFFPAMAAALGWASDRVTAAQDEYAALMDREASTEERAAAKENLEYQQFHAANLRRIYTEGLRMQRAEQAAKK